MRETYKTVRLTLCRGDLLAVCLVLMAAAALIAAWSMGSGGKAASVQIWQDGIWKGEYDLMQDQEIQISGSYQNTVKIQNGRAAIIDSNCPGQDCIKSGWHEDARQSIVCLPNRLELRLVGTEGEPQVDGVTR